MERKRLNILYIEDNPNDVVLMEVMLADQERMECSLHTAGLLATGLARLAQGGVDIILLDLSLPDSHGFATFQTVKNRAGELPIIVMTGLDDETVAVRSVQEGAQDYLIKGQVDAAGLVSAMRYAIERQKLIMELRHTQQQLQTMNSELEQRVEQRTRELQETQSHYLHVEKLTAIGKLSASIAHEFNNPLQSIMSILKGLKKRAILDEEDRDLLMAAIGETERIKNLIRSLQDFNQPSSGKKKVMDVHKSIDSLLLLFKNDFKIKRISVERNYAERLPQILAVPDQIKQVFLNLLTNAADACIQPGGVITISTRPEGRYIAVAIEDTGIGIAPDKVDLIFQPFYTTKPAVKGTGLGLSVCHGIVQDHQGEIQVESRPGSSTFTVLLPVKGG